MSFETIKVYLGINITIMTIILMLLIREFYGKNLLKTITQTWHLITLCLGFLITICIIYKVFLFLGELFYINSYYKNDFALLISSLNFNTPSWVLIVLTFVSSMMVIVNMNFNVLQIIQTNPVASLLGISFSLLLLYTVNIFDCRVTKVTTIFSSGGLDPGTAMACSYFYGYLKIILPASGGTERTGIFNAIEKYKSNQRDLITVPAKKLFILIPTSSYIPPDLKEISDGWLEPTGQLETITIDRAGVKNRTYHNTMYRLRTKGPNEIAKFYYLATEGATPLKTFLEVQNASHRYASLYREYNNEIIRNFYITLQNLLNDNPDCRDYCELVYYEDYINGKRVNPAHVLLERIGFYM